MGGSQKPFRRVELHLGTLQVNLDAREYACKARACLHSRSQPVHTTKATRERDHPDRVHETRGLFMEVQCHLEHCCSHCLSQVGV